MANAEISEDDKVKMAAFAENVSSKAVIYALISIVEQFAPKNKATVLVNRIKNYAPTNAPGSVKLDLPDEYGGYALCISLSLCLPNYKPNIEVPGENFAKEVYRNYELVRRLAKTYWQGMLNMPEISQLVSDINDAISGAPIRELIVDPNNITTLYFRSDSKQRIGIFCWWEDKQGRPMMKRK